MADGSAALAGILDAATAVTAAPATDTTTTSTTEVTTPDSTTSVDTNTESTVEGGEATLDANGEVNTDGQQQTNEGAPDTTGATTAAPKLAEINKALSAWKDSNPDPQHQAMCRTIKDALYRSAEYDKLFPQGVRAARETQQFMDQVAGVTEAGRHATLADVQGKFTELLEFQQNVEVSDNLLFSGSAEVLDNVISDMKQAGVLDNFGKLGIPFLEKLAQNCPRAYATTMATAMSHELRQANVVNSLNQIFKAVKSGDHQSALGLLTSLGRWFGDLERLAEWQDPLREEKAALEKSKGEFAQGKVESFNRETASEADKVTYKILGRALSTYMRLPYFKGFPKESWQAIADQIRSATLARLSGERNYKAQMASLLNAKNPSRAQILSVHQATLERISDEVVRGVITRLHPNWAVRGGRGPAATAAKAAAGATGAQATGAGSSFSSPILIAQKPARENMDMSVDKAEYHLACGRCRLKSTGKWVSWRAPYTPDIRKPQGTR